MHIIIDTREKPVAIRKIVKHFDKNNVSHESKKLVVGDYQSIDNPNVIVDRKQNIQEIWGNVNSGKEHERFRKELLRAMDLGIKLIILIEHGNDITCIEDIYFFWQDPVERTRWKTIDGKKTKETYVQNAIDGKKLYKSFKTMQERYGIEFEFCNKNDTGKKIVELLREP